MKLLKKLMLIAILAVPAPGIASGILKISLSMQGKEEGCPDDPLEKAVCQFHKFWKNKESLSEKNLYLNSLSLEKDLGSIHKAGSVRRKEYLTFLEGLTAGSVFLQGGLRESSVKGYHCIARRKVLSSFNGIKWNQLRVIYQGEADFATYRALISAMNLILGHVGEDSVRKGCIGSQRLPLTLDDTGHEDTLSVGTPVESVLAEYFSGEKSFFTGMITRQQKSLEESVTVAEKDISKTAESVASVNGAIKSVHSTLQKEEESVRSALSVFQETMAGANKLRNEIKMAPLLDEALSGDVRLNALNEELKIQEEKYAELADKARELTSVLAAGTVRPDSVSVLCKLGKLLKSKRNPGTGRIVTAMCRSESGQTIKLCPWFTDTGANNAALFQGMSWHEICGGIL